MCGRFAQGIALKEVPVAFSESVYHKGNDSIDETNKDIFQVNVKESKGEDFKVELDLTRIDGWNPSYNIAPTNTAIMIYEAQPNSNESKEDIKTKYVFEKSKFGLIPVWAKPQDSSPTNEGKENQGEPYSKELGKTESKYFNCRKESLDQHRSVWSSCKKHRCVIPIQGYFEWLKDKKTNEKQPYFVHSTTEPLVFLAGFFAHNYNYKENFNNKKVKEEDEKDGDEYLSSFTIITGPALKNDHYKDLSWLHSRKPLMIEPNTKEWDEWLNPNNEWNDKLIDEVLNSQSNKAYESIEGYEVTKDMGNTANKSKDILKNIGKGKSKQNNISHFFKPKQTKDQDKADKANDIDDEYDYKNTVKKRDREEAVAKEERKEKEEERKVKREKREEAKEAKKEHETKKESEGDGRRHDLTLKELIPRILHERKSFLGLTEESLKEEIRILNEGLEIQSENSTSRRSNEDEDEKEPEEEDPQDLELELGNGDSARSSSPDDVQQKFNKQLFELTKSINNALNETSLSLDFVSLLVASVKPNVAKNTMSPHLSKLVKPSSLNSDKLIVDETQTNGTNNGSSIHSHSMETNEVSQSTKIGQGWKVESINRITSMFKESSEDIQKQVLKEKNFWNMVNTVLSNNEALFRMRDPANNARAIGVKYGYGDSGSDYYDKGMGLLRKDIETGEIKFHALSSIGNRVVDKIYKYIRVRILSKVEGDGDLIITGQSSFKIELNDSKLDLINDIEKARLFLFEEELFYQLINEAKLLITYNVTSSSNKITLELDDHVIEIENMIYDESIEEEMSKAYQNVNASSSINNQKCQLILSYFKLMLCCFYKYNLKLKQKVPTALTKWKQSNSHPLILRPFLGNLKHESYLTTVEKMARSFINQNDIKSRLTINKYSNLNLESNRNPFQKSIEKPKSSIDLKLINSKGRILNINVIVTTNELFVNLVLKLNVFKYESEENESKNINCINILQNEFNNFDELQENLQWVIEDFKAD
ncbi:SRB4 [Candida pseudojiufengensis]|uniref:SRB4 n=1 Tax=Candida pseudojiufengensis TaxID=497109 RepID=UPI002224B146|nr:SRB4 [Candida pseudojiufengensis]KAI5966251.1 SRB4 [Candida pseudojiufengensis]